VDITVSIQKLPCQHVIVTMTAGKQSIKRVYTVQELMDSIMPESIEDVEREVMGQIKKIILNSATQNIADIKSQVEQEIFKV